jgi:integrase
MRPLEPPTGHVFRRDGNRRSTWYAKYRLPDGRQVRKRIGPAWTDRGRPAAGHYTKRTAEAWLRAVLDEARRGTLPGLVRTGATFAEAAAEFLRYDEHDRPIKPSTLTDYRSIVSAHLVPAFGATRVEKVTPEKIERWRATVSSADGSPLSNRTKNKLLVLLHGVFRRAQKVYGLPVNPVAGDRAPSATLERRHPGLQRRGGVCPRPRGYLGAGRRDLPDGGVHGFAAR